MRALRSKDLNRGGGELAHCQQMFDAGLARVFADLAVKRRSHCAHFPHIAQHEPAIAAGIREDIDCRAHRIGIRVVAVVDHA